MIDSLAMEWAKLRPLHKTSRTVGLAIGLAVAVSALVAAAMAGSHRAGDGRPGLDSVAISLQGVNAAVLAIAAFGVLCVTREYGTGMIKVTFLAQPSRLRVLGAKLITHASVALVAAACACLAAFAVGQALLSTGGQAVSWGDPHLPSALAGAVVYLVLICMWGVALGAVLRSSAAAISWLASLLVVAPVIVQILPQHIVDLIGRWLPSQIGQQAIATRPIDHSFAAWPGMAVLAGYVGLTLLVGAWRMVRTEP